jgi:hypothetical protein
MLPSAELALSIVSANFVKINELCLITVTSDHSVREFNRYSAASITEPKHLVINVYQQQKEVFESLIASRVEL